jgi:hypothetical protein
MSYHTNPRDPLASLRQQQHRHQHQKYAKMAPDEQELPPRRPRKVTHRGSHGLFDDRDNTDEMAHANAHEMHQVQTRQLGEQNTKDAKVARRIARGKPAESRLECFVARVFARHDKKSDNFEDGDEKEEDLSERIMVGARGKSMVEEDSVYQPRDSAADSLFLKECGMVRVKGNVPGGCLIVPRNFLLRDDFAYKEDREGGGWM